MKRRIKLSTLLKRTILVALAVVVVSVVLVYFVDKYSPTKNSYINKYDDVISLMDDSEYIDSLIDKYWFLTDEIKNKEELKKGYRNVVFATQGRTCGDKTGDFIQNADPSYATGRREISASCGSNL